MSKKNLIALVVIFAVLVGAISVFAASDYGQNLMGRMTRGISKLVRPSAPKEAWWCAEEPKSTGSEPTGGTDDKESSSSGNTQKSPVKISEDWGLRPSQSVIDLGKNYDWGTPIITEDKDDGTPDTSEFDAPEIKPGGSTEEGEGETAIHCMCDGAWKDFFVPNEDLSKLYDGSTEKYCEAAAEFEECQPHEDLACVCTDPENPTLYSVLTDILNNKYGGDKQAYCDELVSPIYCKDKYLTCKWGFDHDKVTGICDDMYKAMKQAECDGKSYKADKGILEVCEDATSDMSYFLEAPCPTEDECEDYAEMSKSMTCGALTDYLESIGVDSSVSYTCYAFFGVNLPLGGKGCGE